MSLVRVLRTASVVLTHRFEVDEVLTDAAGNVTGTLKRLDGTTVDTQTAGHPDTGVYTYTLPAQSQLDSLTLDWTGTVAGAAVSVRDHVEIVGGFLFGLSEARAMKPALPAAKYPAAMLAVKRIEVEQECEQICGGRAFVPRFMRVAVTGNGLPHLALPHPDLRTLRAISVDGVAWTIGQLAAVSVSESGVLTLNSGVWPAASPTGRRNIIAEYEYGPDYPPADISTAGMIRLRSKLSPFDTGTPSNALSFSVADGGVYRLSTPAADRTGIPEVDAAYARYTQDLGGFA